MHSSIAHFVAVFISICFIDGTLGCFFNSKSVETMSLECSPMNDALRFLNQALNIDRDILASPLKHTLLRFSKPLSNGNAFVEKLSKVITIVNIPVVLPKIDFLYGRDCSNYDIVLQKSGPLCWKYVVFTDVSLNVTLQIKKDVEPRQVSFTSQQNDSSFDDTQPIQSRQAARAALEFCVGKLVESGYMDLANDDFKNC